MPKKVCGDGGGGGGRREGMRMVVRTIQQVQINRSTHISYIANFNH